jgi:membrane-associated phospholipid phosphatase
MHDQAVVLLDATLFGGHGHLALPRVAPWADGFMEVAYLSYYGLVLGPLVVLAWRRPAAACHDYTRVVLATYLVCFACYVVYPVLGPRAVEAAAALGPAAGDDGAVAVWLRRLGDSAGTAFPSSHCAGAAAAALAVGRIVGRRVGLVMGAWALLVAIATVHTGNHYVIDSVAGLAVAVAVHAVAVGRPQDRAAGRLEVSS